MCVVWYVVVVGELVFGVYVVDCCFGVGLEYGGGV